MDKKRKKRPPKNQSAEGASGHEPEAGKTQGTVAHTYDVIERDKEKQPSRHYSIRDVKVSNQEKYAKGNNKAKDVEGVSDDSCEKVIDEKERDSLNSGTVSIQPPVSSMVPTNKQNEGNPLDKKPYTIIDQAKLKQIGHLWLLTVGKKSIQLPKEIKNARVESNILVADGNVLFEIQYDQDHIALRKIETVEVQNFTKYRVSTDEQTTGSETTYASLKETHQTSNASGICLNKKTPGSNKTKRSAQSKIDSLYPSVERKDKENENTEDVEVKYNAEQLEKASDTSLDNLLKKISSMSLNKMNDTSENKEPPLVQTNTQSANLNQTVKDSAQASSVPRTIQTKLDFQMSYPQLNSAVRATAKVHQATRNTQPTSKTCKEKDKSKCFNKTGKYGENVMNESPEEERQCLWKLDDEKTPLPEKQSNPRKLEDSTQATSTPPPRNRPGKSAQTSQDQVSPEHGPSGMYGGDSCDPTQQATGPDDKENVQLSVKLKYQDGNTDVIEVQLGLHKYMKLKYVLKNKKWMNEKQRVLMTKGLIVEYDKTSGTLVISLEGNKPTGDQQSVVDEVIRYLSKRTENLVFNSVPTTGIDKSRLIEHLQQEVSACYLECDHTTDHVHFVCLSEHEIPVNRILQKLAKLLIAPKREYSFNMVFKELFDERNVFDIIKSDKRSLNVKEYIRADMIVYELQGSEDDICWAEDLMKKEVLDEFGHAIFKFCEIKHFEKYDVKQLANIIDEFMQSVNVKDFHWYISDSSKTIGICGPNQAAIDDIKHRQLKNMLPSIEVKFDETNETLTTVKDEIKKMNRSGDLKIVLDESSCKVTFIGLEKKIKLLVGYLQEKIAPAKQSPKTKTQDVIPVEKSEDGEISDTSETKEANKARTTEVSRTVYIERKEIFSYMYKYGELMTSAQECNVRMFSKVGNGKQGFLIRGLEISVQKMEEIIKENEKRVECDSLVLQLTNKSVNRNKIKEELQKVEKTYEVIAVEMKPDSSKMSEDDADDGAIGGPDISVFQTNLLKFDEITWKFPGGHVISVVNAKPEDCWKELQVKVIVNEEPKDSSFEEKSNGMIVTTLYIPKWNRGKCKEKYQLRKALDTLLELSHVYDCFKICIPVNVIGGWPAKQYFKQIICSANDLVKREGIAPTEINLCTSGDQELYRQCCDDYTNAMGHTPMEIFSTRGTTKNIKISIVKGELHKTKAELIVNTTSKDLKLGTGAVSQSLLKAAGPELQTECTKRWPYGIQYGEAVMTSGYKLGCTHVLHGALEHYTGQESLLKLQQFVTDCLKSAASKGAQSIAFPAIGTGNLCYPKQSVAKAMFDGVQKFENFYNGSSIVEVLFVIYPKDTKAILAFEEEKKNTPVLKGDGTTVTVRLIGRQEEIQRAKEALLHYTSTGNLYTETADDKQSLPSTAPEGQIEQSDIEDSSIAAPASREIHRCEKENIETIWVDYEVWEIVKNVKNENVQVLEDNSNVKVEFKDNIVIIAWTAAIRYDDEIRAIVDVLKACCHSLQGKEITEIQLDRYDGDETQTWCNEVQETLDMKCCLHIPKQKKVFAYCDTYDDIQRVKHEFLVKEGKVKPSGRRRRHMEVSDPPADVGHAVFSSAQTEVQSKFGGGKNYEGNQTEKHQHKQLSLPTNIPEDSESIKTVGISPDHSSDGHENSEAVFTEKNKDGYANKDDINASSQDDEIADSDILGSITTTNPVVGVVAGSDMLGSIKATKPAGATFGGSNASEMLGIITTKKPIVQGATGSDMIGSITTARRNFQSTSDSSEEEEEAIQLDTFGIVVRCKKRKGGHSTAVLKAQNTEEALKWRYILSKNLHHRFKHELENVCKSVNIRIESNVAEIDCENNKPSIIEESVKKIITQETIDLRVKEFRINIEQCKKVEEVLIGNSSDFSDQTASLFMESNKCYLVSPAHVFEANIEVFKQTHDFFSTLLRSQATKKKI